MTYLDSKFEVSSLKSARFKWAGGDYLGRLAIEPDLAEDLRALETEPEAYGGTLYEAVFPRTSELREGLHEAVLAAEREKSRLRFRLHLAPDLPEWIHALYWELLTDPVRHLALARSPDTAFSRYLDVRRAQGAPARGRPRLLCVLSAPSDVARYDMADIRRDEILRSLESAFGALADTAEVAFLEPPATLERLRERLTANGGVQLLHFFGHGQTRKGTSALILENAHGKARPVEEELLAELFLGIRELRLVTLIACHSGAPSSSDPFSGLAGRLVERGLPAVIAMRRAVSIDNAHLFTRHLYREIAQTGRADAAVNEARQQLYLADSRGIDWSSPVLYSRLGDGRIWLPWEEAPEIGAPTAKPRHRLRFAPSRLRHPLPWLPAFLALVLLGLYLWPARDAEVRFDLQVTQLFFRLAESTTVIERLQLKEVAATQLAALRLPLSFFLANPPAEPSSSGPTGFLIATRGEGSHVTFHTPPLVPGAGVGIERQDTSSYRITLVDSEQELRVTFQGDVYLHPLGAPPVTLHQEHPDALVIVPRSRAAEIDVTFAQFAPDSFTSNIHIKDLDLVRVIDQQTTATAALQKESTILSGEVHVQATGRRTRLSPGETLHFTHLVGSLTDLRLDKDGIRFGFQGRASKLARVPRGLHPESLMPSILDLFIPRPVQFAVQAALSVLAAAVLLLTVLDIQPRSRRTSIE